MDLDKNLIPLRLEMAGMAGKLFELLGVRPEKVDEKQRQKLAAYAFGMNFAMGMQNRLGPPQVHALAISYLVDTFRYTDQQAVQFAQLMINATAKDSPHPTLKAIGHRGIDGHALLKQGQTDRLREDLQDLLGIARSPAAKPTTTAPVSGGRFRAEREKIYHEFFGKKARVERENGPARPQVDVYTFEPGHNEREFFTMVTGGMSDLPMNLPKGALCRRRAEIILYVDEPKGEYVQLLRWLAHNPHDLNRHYGPGTTMNNGNPPEPIFEGSRQDTFFFLPTFMEPDDTLADHLVLDGDAVGFLWLVPITSKECVHILRHGPEAFLDLMREHDHPMVLDERRKSHLSKKWE
jgi:hypothetical protein